MRIFKTDPVKCTLKLVNTKTICEDCVTSLSQLAKGIAMDKKEIGQKRIQEILGDKALDLISDFKKTSPDFANYITEFAYGDIYAHSGLTDKMRELAAVSCLIGQGNTSTALKAHLNGMLNVGWKKDEIIEVLILLIGYNGFPSIVDTIKILEEITN